MKIDLLGQSIDVFSVLENLKSFQLEIPVEKTVKPVAHCVRLILFSIREKKTRQETEDIFRHGYFIKSRQTYTIEYW